MTEKKRQCSYLNPIRQIMLKRGRGGLPRRIKKLRKQFKGTTQMLRSYVLAELEDMTKIAAEKARETSGKGKAKVKQNWVRLLAYLAQTITYVASGYDMVKIDRRLDELERLFDELNQAKKSGESAQTSESTVRS